MTLCTRRLQRLLVLLKQYNTNAGEIPRITVPQKMIENIEKKRMKKEIEKQRKKLSFKSPKIITCKKSEFNHHKGQTYSDFNPKVLASHWWKGRKSSGDYFTINSYQRNPALLDANSNTNFSDFEIDPQFSSVLEKMNISCPTVIQSVAIPKILEGGNVQVAAETGSGKTLAYLLPLMDIILQQKKDDEMVGRTIPPNCPRCLVLLPTKELVKQIKEVIDQFSEEINITSDIHLSRRNTSNLDILVTTTGKAKLWLENRILKPSHLQYLVLDEADTLLDDSFYTEVRSILNKAGISNEIKSDESSQCSRQIILVSATMPRSLKEKLGDKFPIDSMERVSTKNVHYLMPHVPQRFIKLKPSEKPEEIVLLTKKLMKKSTPSMIFCNKHDTSLWLSRFLSEHSVQNTLMNSKMTPYERKDIFDKFQQGESDILVCTDIASRGLDTIRVQHVVNFDFPNFMSDYIHRAGRVGRVGSHNTGQVTSFITYKWDVDLLWQIETAARKSSELHNVNANIKRKLVSRAENNDFIK